MSNDNVENYTKWLADTRLAMLWIKPIYNIKKNPYTHLELMNDNNANKWNFFESTVSNYSQSTAMNWSWDDL
jgi:ribonucleoside-diphosphate reductase beta chain